MWLSIVEGVSHHWWNKTLHLVNDVMVKHEVREWSVMVRVKHPFLVLQISSHRMRTKLRVHTWS